MTTSNDWRRLSQPRWATPRTEGRRTLGGEAARVARALTKPLMPWQRQVVDVGLELDPETGHLCYREVIITIPRQSGKTALDTVVMCHRMVPIPGSPRPWAGRQTAAFTMQNGWTAHKKFVNEIGPDVCASPLGAALDRQRTQDKSGLSRGVGNAALHWLGRSRIDVVGSNEEAGHGATLDQAIIDEAWADQTNAREQGLLPTMNTRVSPQIFITSTAGTDRSPYLQRKVEEGRAGVEAGRNSRIAYFEWSAPPDGELFPDGHVSRWDDPETWWRCMPALGRLIDLEVIEHAKDSMEEGEFRRAYLNQWTASSERIIPEPIWQAVLEPVSPEAPFAIGIDTSPDRECTAIAIADADGRCEVIHTRLSVDEAIDIGIELAKQWRTRIGIDKTGPAASSITKLTGAGVRVREMGSAQVTQATGMMYDAIVDPAVRIRPNVELDHAMAIAGKHPVGDSWRWGRRTVNGDVTPLMAITLAHWLAKQPEEKQFGSVVSLADLEPLEI